jgi:hypothetical protein
VGGQFRGEPRGVREYAERLERQNDAEPPTQPYRVHVNIVLNQQMLDSWWTGRNAQQLDYMRTYTATHELGHAPGLAHPEECRENSRSIMPTAPNGFFNWALPGFNFPQEFDRMEMQGLHEVR